MEIDFYFEATESFPCVSGGFPYPQPCSCSSIYSNAYLSRGTFGLWDSERTALSLQLPHLWSFPHWFVSLPAF